MNNLQKLIILEGFMQNGLQNRNQRNFLRRTSCVKIDLMFGKNMSNVYHFEFTVKSHLYISKVYQSDLLFYTVSPSFIL